MELVHCYSGSAALEIVQGCKLDLVICHRKLVDNFSSSVLLKRAKQSNPKVYTLLVTKEASCLDKELVDEIDDCIIYPEQVDFRLRKALQRAHTETEIAQTILSSESQIPTRLSRVEKKKRRHSRSKNSKISNGLIKNTLLGLMALFLAILALLFFLQSGNNSILGGYRLFNVVSGSMSPAFDTGSVVIVRQIEPRAIQVGDVITFSGVNGGNLTTHRVVEIQHDNGLSFVTRGDANAVNDPNPVFSEQIVGKVHGTIPLLGYLFSFVQTKIGLVLLVFIPGLLLVCNELKNIYHFVFGAKCRTLSLGH